MVGSYAMAFTIISPPKKSSWLAQIFKAGSVAKGNVVRRNINDVQKIATLADLVAEVKKRQFHMLIVGDQCIIVCNPGYLQVVC
jgi:hypothetical protein